MFYWIEKLERRALTVLVAAALLLSPSLAFASEGGDTGWAWYLQFAGSFVNFAILLYLIVRFGGPKIQASLKARKEKIERDMDEAARLRAEAKEELAGLRARVDKLDEERAALMSDYRKAGEAERDRIIEEAKAQAERIREEAVLASKSESTRARQGLQREILDRAFKEAEAQLKSQALDHTRLVDETITAIANTPH